MSQPSQPCHNRIPAAIIIGTAAYYAMEALGPVMTGPDVNWPSAIAAGMLGISIIAGVADSLKLLSNGLNLLAAKTPKGHKGQSRWASLRDIRKVTKRTGWGVYLGVYQAAWYRRKHALFTDITNMAVFGTTGSGKGAGSVVPNLLAIRDSKLSLDMKGSNSVMVKNALERRGEQFYALNIGNQFPNVLGTAFYNPLHLVADNYLRAGGLLDIVSDCAEMAQQICDDPPGDKGDDPFWQEGGRGIITTAMQQCLLVRGREATLGDVQQLVSDRGRLRDELLWASAKLEGASAMPLEHSPWVTLHDRQDVQHYIEHYRAKADTLATMLSGEETRTVDSFLSVALQALQPYNRTSHAHKVLSKSSFRFADMKDGKQPITAMIVIDPTRLKEQSAIAGLLQWCALTEWKRAQNKSRPVYLIADESSNFRLHNLTENLTFLREYSVKTMLYIQSIGAFRKVYGHDAVNTLLSETDTKLLLPGQRDLEMLSMIQNALGEQSIVSKSHSGVSDQFGLSGFSLQEDGKPLMRASDIRESKKTIAFIKDCRPALLTLPPYSAIRPWSHQVAASPFHGNRRWIKRAAIHIGSRKGFILLRPYRWLKRCISGGRL